MGRGDSIYGVVCAPVDGTMAWDAQQSEMSKGKKSGKKGKSIPNPKKVYVPGYPQ